MAAGGPVVRQITAIPVSVPYMHRERSSVVARDGVSDVVIKLETGDGRWLGGVVRRCGHGIGGGRREGDERFRDRPGLLGRRKDAP